MSEGIALMMDSGSQRSIDQGDADRGWVAGKPRLVFGAGRARPVPMSPALRGLLLLSLVLTAPGAWALESPEGSAEARIVTPRPSFPSLGSRSDSGSRADSDHRAEAERSASSSAPSRRATPAQRASSSQLAGSAVTMASSLAVVLGLFAALVWASRRFGSRQAGRAELPAEAIERLGSHTLDARTRLLLVRCGDRVLVLAQTASGVQPVSEIREPDEVARLITRCRGEKGAAFATTLRSMEREPAPRSFVGTETPTAEPRRGLFASV